MSQETLQAAEVKKIDGLLERLQASASEDLSKEIEAQRERLSSLQGTSLNDAIGKVVSVYTIK